MRTLVTGATGFVGGQVVDELLARGVPARVLVRDRAKALPRWERAGVEILSGDVRDPKVLAAAVRDVDVVHHCAAAVGVHFSRQDIYETNRDGVRHLLEAVRHSGRARVVLVSSVNVLGSRNLDPATEELPCCPSNDPAADVKIEAERLAMTAHAQGVDVTIVRPGFIYGPRDPHNIPKLVRALERGKFAFIGSRSNVVPIVHVSDVVQALLLAAESTRSRGRVYNITDGSRTTIGELIDVLVRLLKCPPPQRVLPFAVPYVGCLLFETLARLGLRRGPAPIHRASLRFLGTSRYVDIRRAREELGYVPRITCHEGLAVTVRSLKEQSEGVSHAAHP